MWLTPKHGFLTTMGKSPRASLREKEGRPFQAEGIAFAKFWKYLYDRVGCGVRVELYIVRGTMRLRAWQKKGFVGRRGATLR